MPGPRRHETSALEAWAHALTNQRIAGELRRIAETPRRIPPAAKAALLREAARRLEEK